MSHKQIQQTACTYGIIGLFFFSLLIPSVAMSADKLPIGASCTSNSQCTTNDCEDSSLDKKEDDFCDCALAADCAALYGTIAGETWECRDGTSVSYNLDFCVSNKRNFIYPLSQTGTPTILDYITDPDAVSIRDEVKEALAAPQPRITIPGVRFSDPKQVEALTARGLDGNTYITIPFLGEYLAALYRYSIIVAGILAVIMIIVAGFQITASGGDSSRIEAGKTRIAQAIVGLGLAVGSYVILYTINPNLVSFRNLKVLYVPGQEIVLEEEESTDYSAATNASIKPPAWTAQTFDCTNKEQYPPFGVMPEDTLETYTCPYGVNGTITSVKELQKPLCTVGEILATQGYGMEITSSYRRFKTQISLWCDRGATEYPDTDKRKSFFAVPGFSNHGHGVAIDAHLMQDGKRLYNGISGSTQCTVDPEYVSILANAFYQADDKFNRLETEIWHFEYDTGGKTSVGKFTGTPQRCGARS